MSTIALTGVVPAVCDAEAGEAGRRSTDEQPSEFCHLRPPKIRTRNHIQTFARFFKNRIAFAPKLSSPTIHCQRGTSI